MPVEHYGFIALLFIFVFVFVVFCGLNALGFCGFYCVWCYFSCGFNASLVLMSLCL